MHDTAYLAISYCKSMRNYLGTSAGSIWKVHRPDGFGILIIFIYEMVSSQQYVEEKKFWRTKSLLIALRRQISSEQGQKVTAANWPPLRYVLVSTTKFQTISWATHTTTWSRNTAWAATLLAHMLPWKMDIFIAKIAHNSTKKTQIQMSHGWRMAKL